MCDVEAMPGEDPIIIDQHPVEMQERGNPQGPELSRRDLLKGLAVVVGGAIALRGLGFDKLSSAEAATADSVAYVTPRAAIAAPPGFKDPAKVRPRYATSPITGQPLFTHSMHNHGSWSEQNGSWRQIYRTAAVSQVDVTHLSEHDHHTVHYNSVRSLSLTQASENNCKLRQISGNVTISPSGATIYNGDLQIVGNGNCLKGNLKHLVMSVTSKGPCKVVITSSKQPYVDGIRNAVAEIDLLPSDPTTPTAFRFNPIDYLAPGASDVEQSDFAIWELHFQSYQQDTPVTLSDLQLDWGSLTGQQALAEQRALRDDLAQGYGGLLVRQSEELSTTVNHFGWYSADESNYDIVDCASIAGMSLDNAAVAQVQYALNHDPDALVTFNHLFGPGGAQASAGNKGTIPASQRAAVVRHLLQMNAYGANVLELGYHERGGAALLPDLLGLAGDSFWSNSVTRIVDGVPYLIPLNGATDDHHASPYHNLANPFCTDAPGSSIDDLAGQLKAMRRGEGYARDINRWQGVMDWQTQSGEHRGSELISVANASGIEPVVFQANQVPTGGRIDVYQGPINPTGDIIAQPAEVVMSVPESAGVVAGSILPLINTFTRFVVFDGNGTPVGVNAPMGYILAS